MKNIIKKKGGRMFFCKCRLKKLIEKHAILNNFWFFIFKRVYAE